MISSLYMALLSLLFILFTLLVIKARQKGRVLIGHGEADYLLRRIRAHANFAEYAPIFLILLFTSEKIGMNAYLLHAMGILFLIGRISHAYGLLKAENLVNEKWQGIWFRIKAMQITMITIAVLSLYLLIKFFI